jgi:hypothetical protein
MVRCFINCDIIKNVDMFEFFIYKIIEHMYNTYILTMYIKAGPV